MLLTIDYTNFVQAVRYLILTVVEFIHLDKLTNNN